MTPAEETMLREWIEQLYNYHLSCGKTIAEAARSACCSLECSILDFTQAFENEKVGE